MLRQTITGMLIRFLEGVVAFLDDLLYIVVDMKVIIYVGSMLALFFVVPEWMDTEMLSTQVGEIILALGQLAGAVLGLVKLLDTWSKSEPNGLYYGQKRMERAAARLLERELTRSAGE